MQLHCNGVWEGKGTLRVKLVLLRITVQKLSGYLCIDMDSKDSISIDFSIFVFSFLKIVTLNLKYKILWRVCVIIIC